MYDVDGLLAAAEREAKRQRERIAFAFETEVKILRPLVEPLVNLFLPELAFLWYELQEDGSHWRAVDVATDFQHAESPFVSREREPGSPSSPGDTIRLLEEPDEEPIPEIMEMWEKHLEDIGFDSMFGIPYGDFKSMDWALREGIVTRQPFLVCVTLPRYYRCSGEYNEWDFEIDAIVVDRLPPASSARDLARFLDETAYYKRETEEMRVRLANMRLADVGRMFLLRSRYYPSYIDDMTPPHGVRVSLCSSWQRLDADPVRGVLGTTLLSAEDDEGDLELALARLRTKIGLEMPDVAGQFETLPMRNSW